MNRSREPWLLAFLPWLLLGLLLCFAALNCSSDTPGSPTSGEHNTELGVSALVPQNSEVARMRIVVRRCGGGGTVENVTPELEETVVPNGIREFEEKPYDADSRHRLADSYFYLDAGCYDVHVEPLDANGQPVSTCRRAAREKVRVRDGRTKEVLLIAQCKGEPRGGLDVLGTVNHEPEIEGPVFQPSKIVECPREVTICISATDPDDDPMRSTFKLIRGPTPLTPPTFSQPVDRNGRIEDCVSFRPGQGVWKWKYKVWDRVWDQGQLVDLEDFARQTQSVSASSHDVLTFPLYGGRCPMDAGIPGDVDDAGPPEDVVADTAPPEDIEQPPEDVEQPPEDVETPPEDIEQPPEDVVADAAPPEDVEEPPEDIEQPPEDVVVDAAPPEDVEEPPQDGGIPPEGRFCSQTQGGYGNNCPPSNPSDNPGCVRDNLFASNFPNGLVIGDPDGPDADGSFAAIWNSASAIQAFLPNGGTASALTTDSTDPTSTSAGVFASQLVAAKLSIAFSDDRTGNDVSPLVYDASCGGNNPFVGETLGNIVQTCDAVIAGDSNAATPTECSEALDDFNNAFVDCNVSTGCFRE